MLHLVATFIMVCVSAQMVQDLRFGVSFRDPAMATVVAKERWRHSMLLATAVTFFVGTM